MTIDTKIMFEEAKKELEKENGSPLNLALRKIIKIERDHFYNSGTAHSRLRDIRDVISEYSKKEND